MISFRFHVVSITAIFLAIAIGVVVGSTYVDSSVVPGLENRIETVEDRADAAREENARLEKELQIARDYIDLSADFAVTDRLVDVEVLVVAARGVAESAVERTVLLARRGGGEVPGVVWLEPRWSADGDEDLEALSAIVGGTATDGRDELWSDAWAAITAELAGQMEAPLSGDEVGPVGTAVLADLEEAGFLSVDSLDDDTIGLADLAGSDPRMLLVSGARAEPETGAVVPVAVSASVDAGLVTVVGDVYVEADGAPARGVTMVETYDENVRELIVLVDAVDLEEGRVAAVLALDDAADGPVGVHYGYGDGADAVLPAWSAP